MSRTELPMIRFLSHILVLFLGVSHLSAQEPEPKEPRGRKAWIVAVAMPEKLENPVKMMSGKDIIAVNLSKRSVGDPIKIPEDGMIRMVREVPNPKDAEKPNFEVLAEAHIADTVSNALVILVPVKPKEGSSLIFASKTQDLAAFRGGETLYMNLSPREILVQLGEEKIPLRQGEVQVTKAERSGQPVSKSVSYNFFDPETKKWQLLSASTVAVYPTRREICIFSWDSNFDRLDYHGLSFPVSE